MMNIAAGIVIMGIAMGSMVIGNVNMVMSMSMGNVNTVMNMGIVMEKVSIVMGAMIMGIMRMGITTMMEQNAAAGVMITMIIMRTRCSAAGD